jgi:hypothetical protein
LIDVSENLVGHGGALVEAQIAAGENPEVAGRPESSAASRPAAELVEEPTGEDRLDQRGDQAGEPGEPRAAQWPAGRLAAAEHERSKQAGDQGPGEPGSRVVADGRVQARRQIKPLAGEQRSPAELAAGLGEAAAQRFQLS